MEAQETEVNQSSSSQATSLSKHEILLLKHCLHASFSAPESPTEEHNDLMLNRPGLNDARSVSVKMKLDLCGKSVGEIFAAILESPVAGVHSLDISQSGLREIPPHIHLLKNLKHLVCRGNEIQHLSETRLGQLAHLESVDFADNPLGGLCQSVLLSLRSIKSLGLSSCQFHTFPEIWTMQGLKHLGLHGNQIVEVPREIFQLQRLRRLDLSRNHLRELPLELGALQSLTWLNLSHNQLSEVPDSLSLLTELHELGLGANKLKHLPDLGRMKRLRILSVFENQLEDLGDWNEALVSLERLDVSSNRLTHLPEAIFQLPNISYINAKSNRIPELPSSARPAKKLKLEYFNIADNYLSTIPYHYASVLRKVRVLDLSNNPFIQHPSSLSADRSPAVSSLRHLCTKSLLRQTDGELAELICMLPHQLLGDLVEAQRCYGCDDWIMRDHGCTHVEQRDIQAFRVPFTRRFCSATCADDYLHPPSVNPRLWPYLTKCFHQALGKAYDYIFKTLL